MKQLFIIIMIISNVARGDGGGIESSWDIYEKDNRSQFNSFTAIEEKSWEMYQANVAALWGKIEKPTAKELVNYSNSNHVRITINYEKGVVVAEVLKEKTQSSDEIKNELKEGVSGLIKDSHVVSAVIKKNELNLNGQNVDDYVSGLTNKLESSGEALGGDGKLRALYKFEFNLVPDLVQRRAKAIYPIVKKYSDRYNLDPAFVLAIIRQESAFNPRAKSWVPAYGLMQIVPQFAGQEVNKALFGQNSLPSSEALYDAEKNIMMGTTYLQILRDKYFASVIDQTKKQFLVTCGYNWGPARIQKAIDKGRIKITSTKNKVFSDLLDVTPLETKDYLKKVTGFHVEFKKMIRDWKLGV